MDINIITDQNFESAVVQRKGFYVLMFSAVWCLPCQDMKPVFADIANRFNAQAGFGIADREDIPALRAKLQISSYPRVYLFQDGQLVETHEVASKNYQREIMTPLARHLSI